MAQERKIAPHTISLHDFQERLAACRAFVVYTPLRTEVDNRNLVTLPFDAVTFSIAPRPSLDPAEEALRAITAIGRLPATIFMPGRRFDVFGTRHGQGGGWYDRFLARVPSEWLRVGFCFEHQFSHDALKREVWDEPMDYVYVVYKDGNGALYETRARSGTV